MLLLGSGAGAHDTRSCMRASAVMKRTRITVTSLYLLAIFDGPESDGGLREEDHSHGSSATPGFPTGAQVSKCLRRDNSRITFGKAGPRAWHVCHLTAVTTG
jgi:hypothetical protein